MKKQIHHTCTASPIFKTRVGKARVLLNPKTVHVNRSQIFNTVSMAHLNFPYQVVISIPKLLFKQNL